MKKRVGLLMMWALCFVTMPLSGFTETIHNEVITEKGAVPSFEAKTAVQTMQTTSSAALSIALDKDIDLHKITTENFEIRGTVFNHVKTCREVIVYFNARNFISPIDENGRFKFNLKMISGFNSLGIMYSPNDPKITGLYKGFGQIEYSMIDAGSFKRLLSEDLFQKKDTVALSLSDALIQKIVPGSRIKLYSYNHFGSDDKRKQLLAEFGPFTENQPAKQIDTGLFPDKPPFNTLSNAYLELIDNKGHLLVTGRVDFTDMSSEYPEGEPLEAIFDSSCDMNNLYCEGSILKGKVSPFIAGMTSATFSVNGYSKSVTLSENGRFEVPLVFEQGYNVLSVAYNHHKMTMPVYADMPYGGRWVSDMNADKKSINDEVYLELDEKVIRAIEPDMKISIFEHTADLNAQSRISRTLGEYALDAEGLKRIRVNINRKDIQAFNPNLGYSFEVRNREGIETTKYRIDIPTFIESNTVNEDKNLYMLTPFTTGSAITVSVNGANPIDLSNQSVNGITLVPTSLYNYEAFNSLKFTLKYKSFLKEDIFYAYKNLPLTDKLFKIITKNSIVLTDAGEASKLNLKGHLYPVDGKYYTLQLNVNGNKKLLTTNGEGYFEADIALEKGLNKVNIHYGSAFESILVHNESPAVSVKEDKNPSVVLLQTPNFKADKIAVTIGNNKELDMTSNYSNGILSLNKDLLAVGNNTVLVTMKVDRLIYQNTLTLQKQKSADSASTGNTSSGGGSKSSSGGGGSAYTGGGYSGGTTSVISTVTPATQNVTPVAKPTSVQEPPLVVRFVSITDKVVGDIDAKYLAQLKEKNASLQLNTNEARFILPISEINTTSIAQKLSYGSTTVAPETVEIRIAVEKASESKMLLLEKLEKNKGITVLSMPVSFSVTGVSGGRFVEIQDFSQMIERRLQINDAYNSGDVVTAVIIEKDGSLRPVPTKIIIDNGKWYAAIHSFSNSDYAVIKTKSSFKDIQTHWAKAYADVVGAKMIMTGDKQMFHPNEKISRGDLAVALVKALGLGQTTQLMFNDVYEDPRATYIQTAAKLGLVSGYKDDSFRPNQLVSREEAMCMVLKAAALGGLDTEGLKAESHYKDSANISKWAKSAVDKCTELELIKGFKGNFYGKAYITNAEISAILVKLLEKAKLI